MSTRRLYIVPEGTSTDELARMDIPEDVEVAIGIPAGVKVDVEQLPVLITEEVPDPPPPPTVDDFLTPSPSQAVEAVDELVDTLTATVDELVDTLTAKGVLASDDVDRIRRRRVDREPRR